MNKLIIGLLLVAAAAGAFFLLRRKKENVNNNPVHKEWIIGKWKTDTVIPGDSSFSSYRYDFQKEGLVVRSLNDSVMTDTANYAWNNASELLWKQNAGDTTGRTFTIIQLNADSLQLKAADRSLLLFTKIK